VELQAGPPQAIPRLPLEFSNLKELV